MDGDCRNYRYRALRNDSCTGVRILVLVPYNPRLGGANGLLIRRRQTASMCDFHTLYPKHKEERQHHMTPSIMPKMPTSLRILAKENARVWIHTINSPPELSLSSSSYNILLQLKLLLHQGQTRSRAGIYCQFIYTNLVLRETILNSFTSATSSKRERCRKARQDGMTRVGSTLTTLAGAGNGRSHRRLKYDD